MATRAKTPYWWADQAPWLVALLDAGARAHSRRARWLSRLDADPPFRQRQLARLQRKAVLHPDNKLISRQLEDVLRANRKETP